MGLDEGLMEDMQGQERAATSDWHEQLSENVRP
jgi:hypothetical protein